MNNDAVICIFQKRRHNISEKLKSVRNENDKNGALENATILAMAGKVVMDRSIRCFNKKARNTVLRAL